MGFELLILAVGALGAAAGAGVVARTRRLPRSLAAAERAAVAASVDDPSFDPGAVLEAAARHFQPIAGRGENEPRLRAIETRFGRWSLDRVAYHTAWWPEDPRVLHLEADRQRFHIAALERDPDGRVTRAVVRVQARVRGKAAREERRGGTPASSKVTARPVAFWVFERKPDSGRWDLARIEPGPAGRHRLAGDPGGEQALVERLRTDSVRDLIEPPPKPEVPYEVASSLPHDPAAALHDLSLVDDRFAAAVIETTVHDLVARWERAAGENRAPLDAAATPRAVRALLDGGYVIRGARVEAVRPVRVWGLRVPPELDVEVIVRAWRGRSDSVRGEVMARHHWWRLAASGTRELPWHLIEAGTEPLPARPRHRPSAKTHVSQR